MYVQSDIIQIIGNMKERNRFYKALREIKEISENMDEHNFQVQSELIAAKCKEALKKRSNILSKKTKEFLEEYEARFEVIDDGGEFYERFQV